MRPAHLPRQRPPGAKLLVADECGVIHQTSRANLIACLRAGDLLVANDASTIPASLHGVHERSGAEVEIRLAGRRTLDPNDVHAFTAVVFGAGDHRTPTEDRPAPPTLRAGDRLRLGPLKATIFHQNGHPRLVSLYFHGTPDTIWQGIASHGKPIQYAHIREPLRLWDVWTGIAARPVAFEPPSAGFLLDWRLLSALESHQVGFATLTHAAGISSTGDPALDARLPLEEPYHVPERTVRAIDRTRLIGGCVVALGTTVTRALEDAASGDGALRAGPGLARLRIGPRTKMRVVDAIVSGAHAPGESHYQVLRAFAGDDVLRRVSTALERGGFRTHEFGDSVMISRRKCAFLARTA